ncbi:TipJ family phage tail tip protein, partial [Acinetobacter baumannii]
GRIPTIRKLQIEAGTKATAWSPSPRDTKAAIDANASAISNLKTRVTNAEGVITSQGNSITQLNNSVTSINSELTKKADATTLNALTNRVSTAEGTITSQGNSITSLRNDLNATNDKVASKADSSALNSLDSKVSEIDGRVTSNTSAVTALQGRVTTVENGLLTKADASALNNYYTKTEADSATSGAIDKFNSQLTIGGVNVVANSEAPRTSTAATNREYLLYERSAELKAFYDENLEKPITISFEMSVPVAGPVQVYSSNGSAHQFVTSVNAIIVNQFAKYSVTVSPKAHTASTTVSTIEFYGTYGTGRIPTIRKLQIEAGTKATAWSPSPRDTKAAIDANASAIQTTQTKVDNIDGRLTTATDSITSLNSRMSTAEGNINSTNTAVGGLSTRMATAEGKITNQSDSIASLQNSVTSINGTLANKADSSAVNNLTSRVETAEGKISSQSGQITSLSNSLDLTNSNLNDVNVLARLLSLGKPLRDDPTFKLGMGGLAPYALQSGSTLTRQAVSADNPTESTYEVLLRATTTLGSGWYPNNPTVLGGPNKAFLVKQVIKMPTGQRVYPYNNPLGTGGFVRMLGNAEGTGKFETYYSIIQCGPDASKSIQGHFRVINSTNPPVPTTSNPVDVILASYEVFDVTAVNDTIPKAYSDAISANANAINSLSNSVTQQGNTITSHSNSITSLNNSITSINSSLTNKADASALNNLSNRVTAAEGNITSQGNSITSLTNSLAVSGKGGTNLLIKSNVVGLYDGVSYPHHTYKLGEVWEIGAKYTLIWCAEHKRGTGDNNSYLAVYAGGGSQTLQSIVNTDGKVISKVTFVKNSAVASGPIIHFYMINRPTADKGTIGTVYWAVLVKGDVLTTDAWIPSPYDYIPDSNANAAAIANLTNTVSQQGNTITSNSSSITSLNNSITNINSTLATKADSSALTNLASRVTATEGAITSHGSSITSLNASVNGLLKDVSVSDTRSTNQPPSWYWSNYPLRIVREFKQASVLGLTGMGTYVSLETYVYWTDASGGPIIQIARGTDSKLTAERRSASTAAWSTWTQDIKAISDGLANKAEASALSSLDSKVSVIDGKVSTQASSITTLQTTVGGNTASIQSQQQSIDGLKARATLKLQSGNLVGGVGIENDSKTVDFIIQANKFAIGAPSTVSGSVTPKYAFVYQSTATTLPNGTVIPAGLYLDSASISYINANKIYADSLSAISANLGTFTSLADQSKPNGARTVISGERIEVYDENNVMRVRIGRW